MTTHRNLTTFLAFIVTLAGCIRGGEFPVTDFGAVGDGVTDCTEAFGKAIKASSRHGGKVVVPDGEYLCRTIHLLDNTTIQLSDGATILACTDPDSYDSFIPSHDLSRYDSGDGTVNANNSRDARWNRALIIADNVSNVVISGKGTIDGRHVTDSLGEEGMRGPHTILMAESSNIIIEGITIRRASNYAFMGYVLGNAVFRDIHIQEGWDGIHVRGGENIEISGCTFETGDDCIAGGYWEGMTIKDCDINSSCNGIRMIMPSQNVLVTSCRFHGPGKFPHRTSGEQRRTNMLFGISLEPGAWGYAPGNMGGIEIIDNTMDCLSSPISVSIRDGVNADDLTVKGLKATGIYGTLSPIVKWNDNGFRSICTDKIDVDS